MCTLLQIGEDDSQFEYLPNPHRFEIYSNFQQVNFYYMLFLFVGIYPAKALEELKSLKLK